MWYNFLILSKFSVGTVEPYSSLECEVTWQPGFDSPERGEFILHISEGNTLKLKCLAHVMIFILRALNWLVCVCVYESESVSRCRVWLCASPWTVAHKAPLSVDFSRQE